MPEHSRGRRPLTAAPLEFVTRGVLAAPRLTLAIAVLIAAGSLLTAALGLGFRGSRLDLLDPQSHYNRRWLAYLEEFGGNDDVVVALVGADARTVRPALEALAWALRSEPAHFASVLAERDLRGLRGKGLHYLSSQEFSRLEQFVDQAHGMIRGQERSLLELFAQAAQVPDSAGTFDFAGGVGFTSLPGLLESLTHDEWPHAETAADSPWQQLEARLNSEPFLFDGGRLGLVLLRLRDQRNGNAEIAIERLRVIAHRLQSDYPQVEVGLTGMPVLESDEMRASRQDTAGASLISLLGVAAVFIAGFGSFRRPLLAVVVLLIALAWTLAYITLAVGHLNILSAAFGVILIGLGIDASIHYLARYEQLVQSTRDRRQALLDTARSVGPGIVTGGATTALAFSTAALTDFTGIAELGVIAAGGILLCILATIAVLPALLQLWDRDAEPAATPLQTAGFVRMWEGRAGLVLLGTGLVTGVLAAGISRVHYDHNLLNLQPASLQSVAVERTLSRRLDRSIWFAVSVAGSRDELIRRKHRFEALPTVSSTEEIWSALPLGDPRRSQRIAVLRDQLADLPSRPAFVPVPAKDELVEELQRLARLNADELLVEACSKLSRLSDFEFFQRLSRFQQEFVSGQLEALYRIRSMCDPQPPVPADLPAAWRGRFVGQSGAHLLRVFAAGNIWEMEALRRFVQSVEAVDPQVTGHPVQTFYASHQMQRSYLHAAVYSLLAVSVVLMLDFRRIRLWWLAMIPMGLGTIQMLGLLGWLSIPLNAANMIVLPLILGIGIDDGVHVVHDFLRNGRNPYRMSNSTATAILLTSATTMIGFGSMMFASHRGLRSLGQVLTMGIACCLLTSLIVLPTLLQLTGGRFSGRK